MITLVVDRNQSKLGYVIDNSFFPISFINSIFDEELIVNETKIGTIIGQIVVVGNNCYSLCDDFLYKYREVCTDYKLKDISFIKRSPNEDELEGLSSYWSSFEIQFKNVYTIVDNNLRILGYFVSNKDIYMSNICYIGMIEILDKNRGIGTKAISRLKKITSIRGLSCVSAVNFWSRNGAKFSDFNRFEIPQDI